jgi:hypothetical protein
MTPRPLHTHLTMRPPPPQLALVLALVGSVAASGCADLGCPDGTVLDPELTDSVLRRIYNMSPFEDSLVKRSCYL